MGSRWEQPQWLRVTDVPHPHNHNTHTTQPPQTTSYSTRKATAVAVGKVAGQERRAALEDGGQRLLRGGTVAHGDSAAAREVEGLRVRGFARRCCLGAVLRYSWGVRAAVAWGAVLRCSWRVRAAVA